MDFESYIGAYLRGYPVAVGHCTLRAPSRGEMECGDYDLAHHRIFAGIGNLFAL